MRYFSTFILALLSILFFASCGTHPEGIRSERGGTIFGFGTEEQGSLMNASFVGAINCIAVPSKAEVNPGETFSVAIQITNGSAPYSAPGFIASSTTPSFSVSGRFNFSYGEKRVIESYVKVTATLGGAVETGYCPFVIGLNP